MLFIQGGVWMLVAEVVVGALLAVQFNARSGQAIDKGIGVGVIVLICLFIAAFGWSWGPLVRARGETLNPKTLNAEHCARAWSPRGLLASAPGAQ